MRILTFRDFLGKKKTLEKVRFSGWTVNRVQNTSSNYDRVSIDKIAQQYRTYTAWFFIQNFGFRMKKPAET